VSVFQCVGAFVCRCVSVSVHRWRELSLRRRACSLPPCFADLAGFKKASVALRKMEDRAWFELLRMHDLADGVVCLPSVPWRVNPIGLVIKATSTGAASATTARRTRACASRCGAGCSSISFARKTSRRRACSLPTGRRSRL